MFNLFAAGMLFVCLAGICPQSSRAGLTSSSTEQSSLVRKLVNHRNALQEGAAKVQRGENTVGEQKELAEYMINEMKRKTPVGKGDEIIEPRNLGETRSGGWWWDFVCSFYPSLCPDTPACASHEFECANTGSCIPGYWECDNFDDCGDLSDEVNCACAADEFHCTSGGCIPDYWQCDQERDCSDASDEQECSARPCGGWEDWGEWTECNAPCGAGQRHRTRVCPCETATECPGENVEYQMCKLMTCLPEAGSGCGTRQPEDKSIQRIVGGEDAARGAWPWYAQLYFDGTFSCGGTLVENKYIVTAAHCVSGPGANVAADWKVYLGKNRENDSENNDEHVSDVTHIIIHGNYNDETTDNDIAVMVLASQPPEESRFINSVCLDAGGSAGFDGTSVCYIAGFGLTQEDGSVAYVLQEALVPIVNTGDCNNAYGGQITDNMICAGYQEGGIDSCQGDSGGPLVCSRRDESANVERWYLTGITSWGYGCARPNYPGVYAKVARYGDWLENVFASHSG
ncbi:serine protease hepsin-like [Asterias rubens]|uniref:serine protease hepsin-like n=1 Tax=Asterias rubens TaxID=7604 RepID=UPI0014552E4A|nr:serine protease hepsin-like [Asterias rubens]